MEDLVIDLTRGNPSSVKTVLASVVLALAVYQLLLAAIGYRKLPVGKPGPAFFTHRASGDMLAVLIVVVALMCLAVFGFEGDYALHMEPLSASLVVLASEDRRGALGQGRPVLPYLGTLLFLLLAVTWFTVAPDFLAGED